MSNGDPSLPLDDDQFSTLLASTTFSFTFGDLSFTENTPEQLPPQDVPAEETSQLSQRMRLNGTTPLKTR